jgi:hypothetical protein
MFERMASKVMKRATGQLNDIAGLLKAYSVIIEGL